MTTVTIDFVARGARKGSWAMVLVEEGPWNPREIEANLRRLQERLYNCVDAAIDGRFSERFPETHGGQIVIRLDGYDLPQTEVTQFFQVFSGTVLHIPEYANALRDGKFVSSITFELNLEHLKH